jgi:hypothetical protein
MTLLSHASEVSMTLLSHASEVSLTPLSQNWAVSTGVRSVLTSLSRGVNSPLPAFAWWVIERCGFGSLPKTVQRQLYSKKERESGPDWEPATPRTLRGPRLDTDWIGWSVYTVKLSGRGVSAIWIHGPTSDKKTSKWTSKHNFWTSCQKFKNICKTFLQG